MTTAANTGSSLSKAQHLWTQHTTSTAADDTHAVVHPSLALRATPEAGVGIAATAPINAGETLLIIPPALQITPRTSAIHSHLPTDGQSPCRNCTNNTRDSILRRKCRVLARWRCSRIVTASMLGY